MGVSQTFSSIQDNQVALAGVRRVAHGQRSLALTLSRKRVAMGLDRTLSSILTTMWRWRVLEASSRRTFAGAHVVQGEGGYGVNRPLSSIQTTMWYW